MQESKRELTQKQRKVLQFIQSRMYEDAPPTIREIGEAMGFSSTGTVRDYLGALEKKGYLKRKGSFSRSIQLLKEKLNRIPIVASIPAGPANLAYEDVQGYVGMEDILPGTIAPNEVFALRVKGDSMMEAGIMEGDLAIIRRQAVAGNGEIIAALLENNEVTLKRLRHLNNATYLEPANINYQPIRKEFTIIGRVITVLRKY
jgi:repressor LexA